MRGAWRAAMRRAAAAWSCWFLVASLCSLLAPAGAGGLGGGGGQGLDSGHQTLTDEGRRAILALGGERKAAAGNSRDKLKRAASAAEDYQKKSWGAEEVRPHYRDDEEDLRTLEVMRSGSFQQVRDHSYEEKAEAAEAPVLSTWGDEEEKKQNVRDQEVATSPIERDEDDEEEVMEYPFFEESFSMMEVEGGPFCYSEITTWRASWSVAKMVLCCQRVKDHYKKVEAVKECEDPGALKTQQEAFHKEACSQGKVEIDPLDASLGMQDSICFPAEFLQICADAIDSQYNSNVKYKVATTTVKPDEYFVFWMEWREYRNNKVTLCNAVNGGDASGGKDLEAAPSLKDLLSLVKKLQAIKGFGKEKKLEDEACFKQAEEKLAETKKTVEEEQQKCRAPYEEAKAMNDEVLVTDDLEVLEDPKIKDTTEREQAKAEALSKAVNKLRSCELRSSEANAEATTLEQKASCHSDLHRAMQTNVPEVMGSAIKQCSQRLEEDDLVLDKAGKVKTQAEKDLTSQKLCDQMARLTLSSSNRWLRGETGEVVDTADVKALKHVLATMRAEFPECSNITSSAKRLEEAEAYDKHEQLLRGTCIGDPHALNVAEVEAVINQVTGSPNPLPADYLWTKVCAKMLKEAKDWAALSKGGGIVIDLTLADFSKATCPRRLWLPPDGKDSVLDFEKNEWTVGQTTWGVGPFSASCRPGAVEVHTQIFNDNTGKMEGHKVCECPADTCPFNGECLTASEWVEWGKRLVHAAGPYYVENEMSFSPEQNPKYIIIKKDWESRFASANYGKVKDANDPWGTKYTNVAATKKPRSSGLFGIGKVTCDDPFVKRGGTQCICPDTSEKNGGNVVKVGGKETCIRKEGWPKLFKRWLDIVKVLAHNKEVVAQQYTQDDFSLDRCKSRRTQGSCQLFKCDAARFSVCMEKSKVCECNGDTCLLDYGILKAHRCLNFISWRTEGLKLSEVPGGQGFRFIEEEDGTSHIKMPEYPNFAVGDARGCERRIGGSTCTLAPCDASRHAYCEENSCRCNIDKCVWDGRCIDFDTWLYVVKQWATISSR